MTKVKICGINDPVAFDTAVEAGADWIGFVFFPPSPRHVTPKAAAALAARGPAEPHRIGLFVNPEIAAIARVLDTMHLDALQIYAPPDDLRAISDRFGLPVWRPVGITTQADLPTGAPTADRLVIEAQPPPGADRPGGNATSFDWSILAGWPATAPWILAGGLTPNNVAVAIRRSGADAVDVSSGVESRKGVKDAGLIRAFIAAAKSG